MPCRDATDRHPAGVQKGRVGKHNVSTPSQYLARQRRRYGWASAPHRRLDIPHHHHTGDPAVAGSPAPGGLAQTSAPGLPAAAVPWQDARGATQRLKEDLERAHAERLPGARLMIARPAAILDRQDRIHAPHLHPALFISEARDGRSIMGVLQRMQDVDFTFLVPFLMPPPRAGMPPAVDELHCRLCYNPTSDACEFVCASHPVRLVGECSGQSHALNRMQVQTIAPSMWKVSVPMAGSGAYERPVVEFLLLKRTFEVTVTQKEAPYENRPDESARQASAGDASPKKSTQEMTTTEFVMQRACDRPEEELPPMRSERVTSVAPRREDQPVKVKVAQESAEKVSEGPLAELHDGQTASISTAPAKPDSDPTQSKGSYQITRISEIAKNCNSSVYTCFHSDIPQHTIVTKVINVRPRTVVSVASLAEYWRQEMKLLERLQHPNIVRMQGYDGRFFALYLEHLPHSLSPSSHNRRFTPADALAILRDVSSALAHLDRNHISHNDIKPSNIAYSRDRGAVILDFGLATSGLRAPRGAGGTAWYVAPEAADHGQRGWISNVWALGVTMLYVLGRLEEPEAYGSAWDFGNVADAASEDREAMEYWLEEVYFARDELEKGDLVQDLVYEMLERDPRYRIEARVVEERLQGVQVEETRQ